MKTIKHTCDECDNSYTLKFDDDKSEGEPHFCPFCAEYIIDKDDEVEDED